MDESGHLGNKEPTPQKPPLSVGRIAGEILAGTAGGLVALVSVYAVLIRSYDPSGEPSDAVIFCMFVCVFPPLHGLASAVGVYLVGNIGEQTGSFLPTLGCAFPGACVALAAMSPFAMAPEFLMGIEKIVLWASVLFTAPILATLGFNATRREK